MDFSSIVIALLVIIIIGMVAFVAYQYHLWEIQEIKYCHTDEYGRKICATHSNQTPHIHDSQPGN